MSPSMLLLMSEDGVNDDDGGGVADADANLLFFRSHRGLGESLCPQL